MARKPTSTASERAKRGAATRRANRERAYWDISDGSGRRPKIIRTFYAGTPPTPEQMAIDIQRITGRKL